MITRQTIQDKAIEYISSKYYNEDNFLFMEIGTGSGKSKILLESAKNILNKKNKSVIVSTSNNLLVRELRKENLKHNIVPDSQIELFLGVGQYLDENKVLSDEFTQNVTEYIKDAKEKISDYLKNKDKELILTDDFIAHFNLPVELAELININNEDLSVDSVGKLKNRLSLLALDKQPKIILTNNFFLLLIFRYLKMKERGISSDEELETLNETISDEFMLNKSQISKIKNMPILIDEVHTLRDSADLIYSSSFSVFLFESYLYSMLKNEKIISAFPKKTIKDIARVQASIIRLKDFARQKDLEKQKNFDVAIEILFSLAALISELRLNEKIRKIAKKNLLSLEEKNVIRNMSYELTQLFAVCKQTKRHQINIELSEVKKLPKFTLKSENSIPFLRSGFFAYINSFVCGISGTLLVSSEKSIDFNKWSFERIGLFEYKESNELTLEEKEFNKKLSSGLIFKVFDRLFRKEQARYFITEDEKLLPPKKLTKEYISSLAGAIKNCLHKNSLILTSSFDTAFLLHESLSADKNISDEYKIFYATRSERMSTTVSNYRKSVEQGNKSILIGGLSYFVGIDLAYDYCNTLIICRLPFEAMENLKTKARFGSASSIANNQKKAILTFRQGLGRGLRAEDDNVCIALLDPRINKNANVYRMFRYFLNEMAIKV